MKIIPDIHPPEMKLPVQMPDGTTAQAVFSEDALSDLADRLSQVKKPLVGYAALKAALEKVGIKKEARTLREWKQKRLVPYRKFNKEVVFYLDEVLARIGGRA